MERKRRRTCRPTCNSVHPVSVIKFRSVRLTSRDQSRWESTLLSKTSRPLTPASDVYIWKAGSNGLLPLGEEQWQKEVINAAARCAREGDPVQASISSHLLRTVAGKPFKLT